MKIITWNINGLRAWLNKGSWQWITAQAPDILCLQEIKARPDQLTAEQLAQFAGYEPIWNPAERPGYSGTVTFVRTSANEARLGLDDARFDNEGEWCKPFTTIFACSTSTSRTGGVKTRGFRTNSIFTPACWTFVLICTPKAKTSS